MLGCFHVGWCFHYIHYTHLFSCALNNSGFGDAGIVHHVCSGPQCCPDHTSPTALRNKVAAALQETMLRASPPVPQTGRWTKLGLFLDWAMLALFGGFSRRCSATRQICSPKAPAVTRLMPKMISCLMSSTARCEALDSRRRGRNTHVLLAIYVYRQLFVVCVYIVLLFHAVLFFIFILVVLCSPIVLCFTLV